MNFKIFTLAFIFPLVSDCLGQSFKKTETGSTNNITLSSIKKIPEELEGCECFFSETTNKYKNKEYIFVANMDSLGFISVNDELIVLKLIYTDMQPLTFGDYDHTEVYNSYEYKVTLNIKYKNSTGDESWWSFGTISVEKLDGQKVIKKFVGECGC